MKFIGLVLGRPRECRSIDERTIKSASDLDEFNKLGMIDAGCSCAYQKEGDISVVVREVDTFAILVVMLDSNISYALFFLFCSQKNQS